MQEDEGFFLEAFLALSETRDVSLHGVQRIKFTEIEAWLNIRNIRDTERREEIAHFVRYLDGVWLEGLKHADPKSGNQ